MARSGRRSILRTQAIEIPIIVLPGIMGSRLIDSADGALVWNPKGTPMSDPGRMRIDTRRLIDVSRPLDADRNGRHPFRRGSANARIAAQIPGYYGLIHSFYGDLIATTVSRAAADPGTGTSTAISPQGVWLRIRLAAEQRAIG